MIFYAGIISAASSFLWVCCSSCNRMRCKTCTVVGSYIAAALAFLGVILLASSHPDWCQRRTCMTYDADCTEVDPHFVDPAIDPINISS